MPVLRGFLQPEGALVEILLGWSAAGARQQRVALRPVPPPVQARGLLDTGAEITCVDGTLIQQLGLPFSGTVAANLPAHGGLTFASLHDASMTVLHPSGKSRDNLVVLNVTVLDISVSSLGYQALLGRDVLARCGFLYDGPNNEFRLGY
jgi:hypothetical protein